MPSYTNGYIPDSLLITFNVGVSSGEGVWKHQLSPGTYAKHLALVALARKNTGRTLQISTGWGAYRPMPAQVYARKVHGNGAAVPGTSSHGGFWEKKQTLAIDYGNWAYVYNGDRAAFYRDVRAVGLEPGLISPQRGYPDEPWHVVDLAPWAAAGAAGTSEEDVMNDAQEKKLNDKLDQLIQALGAGGLVPGLWPDTIMGNTRDIKAQVNGLPDALKTIVAQVNGVPDVLAAIRKDIKGVTVSGGQVDVPALSAALAKELSGTLGNAVATAVLDGAAQRLIR